EKALCFGYCEQLQDGSAAGRNTRNCYVLWISSKCRDIVLNPMQRLELIHCVEAAQRFIWLCNLGKRWMREATLSQVAIVEVDENNSVARECRAVPVGHIGGTTCSVKVNDDRRFTRVPGC